MKPYTRKFEEAEEKDLNEVVNYFEKKINVSDYYKKDRQGISGREITYTHKRNKFSDTTFSFTIFFNEPSKEIALKFFIKGFIPGESLDDPLKPYQTTSAMTFKKKKLNLDKFFDTPKKAIKAIDNYFKKLESF